MLIRRITAWILCLTLLIFILPLAGCSKKTPAPESETQNDPQPSSSIAQNDQNTVGTSNNADIKYTKLIIADNIKKEINIPYEPLQFERKVQPYKVLDDLSNIVNLNQFGSFSKEQMGLLSKNAFVVSQTKEEQLFYIYEKNEYLKIPNFITTDSILQVYHVFYDYSLRRLEADKLIKIMEDLTESMLLKSIFLYAAVKNTEVKEALMKNAAYFSVAQMALKRELPPDTPKEIKTLAEKEYALINKESGFQKSVIFPFLIDYSQFKPRGHYSKTDDHKRYFKAMMWYGQAPFPLYKDKGETERNTEQTLQALLLTYTIFLNREGTPDIELWEKVYEPTVFYVGKSDDLTLYNYKDLLLKVYGQNPDIESLNNKDMLDRVYKEAKGLPEPRIKAKYASDDVPVGKQLRFMGQRYIPDSEIIQELVDPVKRPIPSGLDVMGVLGSDSAYEIEVQEKSNTWEDYPKVFTKMRETFSKVPEPTWRSNMYYGWLWTLKSLAHPSGNGYPSFMANKAWEDKSLNTALGSWSELRHDTILYGKETGAECGGWELPEVLGYVEPSVETYNKLLWLTRYSRENLAARGILSDEFKNTAQYFEDTLNFLIRCSIKELRNEELTKEEYSQILTFGGLLEGMTSSLASDGGRWRELTSESDKNMAIIADFYTVGSSPVSKSGYMEAGVGPANEIYAVVPINGKLYLTRGAVFSYYEFLNTSGGRLTDEEWQRMIKENKNPKQPSWMDSFINGEKDTIPVPANPFNSGC